MKSFIDETQMSIKQIIDKRSKNRIMGKTILDNAFDFEKYFSTKLPSEYNEEIHYIILDMITSEEKDIEGLTRIFKRIVPRIVLKKNVHAFNPVILLGYAKYK